MEEVASTENSGVLIIRLVIKTIVWWLPFAIVRMVFSLGHPVLWAWALVAGVFLQALIPPRRKLFAFYLIFSLLLALVWYAGVDT
jgi:hypothetical protein